MNEKVCWYIKKNKISVSWTEGYTWGIEWRSWCIPNGQAVRYHLSESNTGSWMSQCNDLILPKSVDSWITYSKIILFCFTENTWKSGMFWNDENLHAKTWSPAQFLSIQFVLRQLPRSSFGYFSFVSIFSEHIPNCKAVINTELLQCLIVQTSFMCARHSQSLIICIWFASSYLNKGGIGHNAFWDRLWKAAIIFCSYVVTIVFFLVSRNGFALCVFTKTGGWVGRWWVGGECFSDYEGWDLRCTSGWLSYPHPNPMSLPHICAVLFAESLPGQEQSLQFHF